MATGYFWSYAFELEKAENKSVPFPELLKF